MAKDENVIIEPVIEKKGDAAPPVTAAPEEKKPEDSKPVLLTKKGTPRSKYNGGANLAKYRAEAKAGIRPWVKRGDKKKAAEKAEADRIAALTVRPTPNARGAEVTSENDKVKRVISTVSDDVILGRAPLEDFVEEDEEEPPTRRSRKGFGMGFNRNYLYLGLGAVALIGGGYIFMKYIKKAKAPEIVIPATPAPAPRPLTRKFDAGNGLIIDIPIKYDD